MYDDIVASLNRAMVLQKWNEGPRVHRIGNPFQWLNVELSQGWRMQSGLSSFMKYFTMFDEEYPTPNEIKCSDFEEVLDDIRQAVSRVFRAYFPWAPEDDYANYLSVLALTRAQDYSFIKSFSNIKSSGIKHLDLGPGLGSSAVYSRGAFKSQYCGLEAYPESYQVQRDFFRCYASADAPYVDFIAAETFGVSDSDLAAMLNRGDEGIIHIPSWKFPLIKDSYFDLVTASWVLSELNHAAVLWLISGAVRTLQPGGYFYIRDSGELKPGHHDVNYDTLLAELGFQEAGRLNINNRVNFFGIPRIYRKTARATTPDFDELVDSVLGRLGVFNVESMPTA